MKAPELVDELLVDKLAGSLGHCPERYGAIKFSKDAEPFPADLSFSAVNPNMKMIIKTL